MEESKAKLKKMSTETLRGRLLSEDIDLDAILKATRDELIEFVLQEEGHNVGVKVPKKVKGAEASYKMDPMQMLMQTMIELEKQRILREEERESQRIQKQEEKKEQQRVEQEEKEKQKIKQEEEIREFEERKLQFAENERKEKRIWKEKKWLMEKEEREERGRVEQERERRLEEEKIEIRRLEARIQERNDEERRAQEERELARERERTAKPARLQRAAKKLEKNFNTPEDDAGGHGHTIIFQSC